MPVRDLVKSLSGIFRNTHEVGNGEFDDNHLIAARAHMSLWAITASPLILGNDLRRATPGILDIIRNRAVIAINQDPGGHQGVVVSREGDGEVVVKALSAPGRKAVTFINRGDSPLQLSASLADLGLSLKARTSVRDVWLGTGGRPAIGRISVSLKPRETALFVVEGQPMQSHIALPADMPARFNVADEGYKAPDRTPIRQWVLAQIGFQPYGEPLLLDGRHDHEGLGVAAGSRVGISLNGDFKRVTLDPRLMKAGSGSFIIRGDGRILQQGVATDQAQPLSLDVRGIQKLELIAPPATTAVTAFAWHTVHFQR